MDGRDSSITFFGEVAESTINDEGLAGERHP
jgi:hypothetical protein